jgi:hypothetical protein
MPADEFLNLFPHICTQCEDMQNPVTSENGMSVSYPADGRLTIEVYLHSTCAEAWSREFGLPVPAHPKSAVQ